MEFFDIRKMELGYFIGDFNPTVYRTNNVELSIKTLTAGTLDSCYYRKKDTQIVCVLSGTIECFERILGKGDIVSFRPGDMISLFALEDAEILITRLPGTKNDLNDYNWNGYDDYYDYYSSYLTKLRGMVWAEGLDKNAGKGNHNIRNCDISVIVQGYVDQSTSLLLSSIRRHLEGATIILSTWDYCDVEGLDYDVLVCSNDPGAVPCEIWDGFKRGNNGNRQIVSTKAGLKKVKTKYVLKLRSDLVLLGNDFVDYMYLNIPRNEEYTLFSERIVIGELFSRKRFIYSINENTYDIPKPFHPSDWFAFGLTEDLNRLYDPVELIPLNEFRYNDLIHKDYIEKYEYKYSWRYTTEQHIMLPSVRKKFSYRGFNDWTDWDDAVISFSDGIMKNNFVFLDTCRSAIISTKYRKMCFANNDLAHPEEGLYSFYDIKL